MIRAVLGRRADGSFGLFASKSGFDADATGPDNLLLGLTQFTEQLILAGVTTSLPALVAFPSLANPPYVFLTSTDLTLDMGTSVNSSGYSSNFTTSRGMFARPYPTIGNPNATCRAAVSNINMQIDGGSPVVAYLVYRRRVAG